MKIKKFIVMTRWPLALSFVVAAGVASVWVTESISPAKMNGWQRLHFTLPFIIAAGYLLARTKQVSNDLRESFSFSLAATLAVFVIAAWFMQRPSEPGERYMSIFVCLPLAVLLIEAVTALNRLRK